MPNNWPNTGLFAQKLGKNGGRSEYFPAFLKQFEKLNH
jgi:hypothetical protein